MQLPTIPTACQLILAKYKAEKIGSISCGDLVDWNLGNADVKL